MRKLHHDCLPQLIHRPIYAIVMATKQTDQPPVFRVMTTFIEYFYLKDPYSTFAMILENSDSSHNIKIGSIKSCPSGHLFDATTTTRKSHFLREVHER